MPVERRKHIVVVSQFFPPEPAPYSVAVAKALQAEGYKVSVVTGYPNRPGGKLYKGYKQRVQFSEILDGIHVTRVPLIINHSRKAIERALNFLSFSISALSVSRIVKGADAVYVYATPATAAIPAQIWRKLFGTPYVLHVQDLWPESVTESGMIGNRRINQAVSGILRRWTDRLYQQAEALIAISSGMRNLLVHRGNNANSCAVVYNWANEPTIVQKSSSSFAEGPLRLLYAGNIGPMQDVETIIGAASLFRDRTDFHLTVAGGGLLEDVVRKKTEKFSNVDFVGRFAPAEASSLYLQSDFQLVTLKDRPIFRTTVPSKLQASLASAVPVITTVKGSVARLIQQYEAGIVAEPENEDSLAAAFHKASEMSASDRARMGRNARRLYEGLMAKSAGTSSIVSIFDKVLAGSSHEVSAAGVSNDSLRGKVEYRHE